MAPTHGLSISALTETPEQWDALYKRFCDLLAEFTGSVSSISIHSHLMDDEDAVDETEYYDEFTKLRVINTIKEALDANHGVFVTGSSAVVLNELAGDIAEFLEEAGILFRERRRPVEEA